VRAATVGSRARDTDTIERFLLRLSSSLSAGRGLPATDPEVADPDLRRRLASFVSNAGRLPTSVHGRLAVALNQDQVPSKMWLIKHLASSMLLQDSRILVVGGWFGVLPLLLQCLYSSWRIRTELIDLDPAACEVASTLLEGVVEDATITCLNANEIDYVEFRREPRGIIVNTICEHMSDFAAWFERVQPGQAITLQSNDHRACSEHTNCVASLEELEAQAPLVEKDFRGTLRLARFQRFMLIGRR
jgi:hypothetical protein